jgi:hypothetical protein
LDATHTQAEKAIYSVMYRETISKGRKRRRFSQNELAYLTGMRSVNTIKAAVRGLSAKCSITQTERPMGTFGAEYEVYAPREIFAARRQLGMEIDPVTKRITAGAPSATPSATPSTSPSTTPSTSAPMSAPKTEQNADALPPSTSDGHENNRENSSDSAAAASSSHDQIRDDERLAKVQKLFEQLSNGGHWKPERDLMAYQKIAHIPLWHIIMGLCVSVGRCPEHRFSSLEYAVPEILNHYRDMGVFEDERMLQVAYRTMRQTLNSIKANRWTIAEWDFGEKTAGKGSD